jgi:hypothetical protein
MSDATADVLDDAADLLEREGWIQRDDKTEHGRCAVGALIETESEHRWAARDRLLLEIGRSCRTNPTRRLMIWNDAPGRTKQQVLDAFRAAAKQERMAPGTSAPADPPVGWGEPNPGRRAPTSG